MKTGNWFLLSLGLLVAPAQAQDQSYLPQSTQDVGYGEEFGGPASFGSQEPLYRYDDQERWKHGYFQTMPFYGGHKSFRPYNYHHVFSQSQTAAGWGMPATMPYSQQFWHRYSNMTDLSRGDHSPVAPYQAPPAEFDHYPRPINNSSGSMFPPPGPSASYQSPTRMPMSQVVYQNAQQKFQQYSDEPVIYEDQIIQRTNGVDDRSSASQFAVPRQSAAQYRPQQVNYPSNSRQQMQKLQQSRQAPPTRSGNVYQTE